MYEVYVWKGTCSSVLLFHPSILFYPYNFSISCSLYQLSLLAFTLHLTCFHFPPSELNANHALDSSTGPQFHFKGQPFPPCLWEDLSALPAYLPQREKEVERMRKRNEICQNKSSSEREAQKGPWGEAKREWWCCGWHFTGWFASQQRCVFVECVLKVCVLVQAGKSTCQRFASHRVVLEKNTKKLNNRKGTQDHFHA